MFGVDQICTSFIKAFASHPLVLSNPITDVLTNRVIPITNYRLYGGIETTSNALTMAVYPAPSQSLNAKSPGSQSAAVIYEPYSLGTDYTQVNYLIHISFYYNVVTSGSKSTPIVIQNMPTQLPSNDAEIVLDKNQDLLVYTDASMHILSQCIELLRLIIYDIRIDDLNTKLTLLSSAFIGGQWEKDPYFKEVLTSCLVTCYLPKYSTKQLSINTINLQV